MIRRSRCPPLPPRGGHLCSGLLLALLAAAPLRLPAQEAPYRDYILLGFGWGALLPLTPGFSAGAALEDIEAGPLLDDLVRAILVRRIVGDRIAIDIDHDAERLSEGEYFGGDNIYSLRWMGREGEALREVSVGNLERSIPGSPFLPIDTGGAESFALTARAQLGPVALEGLARYGAAVEGRRRFRGSRLSIRADLRDVSYVRGRFFLLPDAGIDEAGLKVAKSSPTGPILIDGRRYELLARETDWKLDNAAGRLTLEVALAANDELAVTYTKAGTRVGDPILGQDAVIDASGTRRDFDDSGWPEYFGMEGATRWLFLKRKDLGSYWELRNTFLLEDLEEGRVPEQVSVQILRTATLASNAAYDELADDFRVSVADATISFEFVDGTGEFYPRPFPGEEPFGTLPVGPGNNPFDPDNPVYGGPSYAPADASVTTARVSYLYSTDTYRLEAGLIADSVRVTVDGQSLPSSSWTVDAEAGTITFAHGVIGPQSDVEVVFRWTPVSGMGREFFAAAGASIGDDRRWARNLLTFRLPIAEAPVPRLGEEQPARMANSLDAFASFGARAGEPGFTATVEGSAALGLTAADLAGASIIADMEDDRKIGISLSEAAWILATPSTLLPLLPTPVTLGDRGDLRYENLREDLPFGGSVLHEVSWDNSANPQFTYAEKAGPYASADAPPGSSSTSLVLDVEFPVGATNAWTAASTVFAGVDAGSAEHLTVWLRGVGVAGGPLRVYAEALSSTSEDLDGDGAIDGEASAASAGYPIVPTHGGSTVLGTDRFGESNGRLDSEDRNGNGVLDVPAADTGVVLCGPTPYLASLPVGTSDWVEATVDVTTLVSANPATFRALRAIRLTVVPAVDPGATPITGRILVGGFSFSSSRFATSTSSFTAREVAPGEDTDLAAAPFDAAFPEVYRKLHGDESYREEHGIRDQSLACDLLSDLAAGERAVAELSTSPPVDLSGWKLLKLYVLVPTGSLPPADASFLVQLESGSDALEAALSPATFHEGWNEIAVLLEDPWTVTVNDAAAGQLAGSSGVVRRVSAVGIGLEAGPSGISAPLGFLTDEWHLAEVRLRADTAAKVAAMAGWRGALLSLGDLPLVSDLFLSAGWQHASGTFLGAGDRAEDRWKAGLETRLADSLSVSFAASQAYGRPTEPDPDVRPGLEDGSTDLRSLSLRLDARRPWVPVIEHRWDRSRSVERDPVIAATGTQVMATETDRETLSLSERLEPGSGLAQWASFSRSWTRDATGLLEASDGAVVDERGTRGLLEAGEAGLSWTWDTGSVTLQAARDRLFAAPDDPDPADGSWSYFHRLAAFFREPSDALPGALERTLRDRLAFEFELPRAAYLGAALSLEADYSELNVDAAAGCRDVNTRDALSLSAPISPDGKGRVLLTPSVSVTFTGAYRGVDDSIGEGDLLFGPWAGLLLVPLTWSRTLEHAAADPFADNADVPAASNTVNGRLALVARIAQPEWYVPSRATLALEDTTGRAGESRSQERELSFALGKDAIFPKGRTLSFDATGSWTRDFAAKTRSLALSARTSAGLPALGGGALSISQTSTWTRSRQSLGDSLLWLLPDIPDDPGLVVAPQGDEDVLYNSLELEYRWVREGSPAEAEVRVRGTAHTERLKLESLAKWLEPGVVSSSVPLRFTFEHRTEIDVTETLTLGIWGKAAAGIEKRTGSGEDLLLPAIGIEAGITGKMRF